LTAWKTAAAGAALVAAFILLSGPVAQAIQAQSFGEFEEELVSLARASSPFCVRIEVVRRESCEIELLSKDGVKRLTLCEKQTVLSGILLDAEGHVATLGEALKGARRVSASLCDEEGEHLYKARVIGIDPTSDMGVIKLESDKLFNAPVLGDPGRLAAGSFVIGLGFPYELRPNPSLSLGIVSALQRDFTSGSRRYRNLIETSFQLKPGESGGPLFNSAGEVVGLLLTSYPGFEQHRSDPRGAYRSIPLGVTLAVPINVVRDEVESILERKGVAKAGPKGSPTPWLGLVAEEISDPVLRDQLKVGKAGVMVRFVYPGQPASRAGLRKYDILLKWDKTAIHGIDQLKKLVSETGIGGTIDVILIRNGAEVKKKIVVGQN